MKAAIIACGIRKTNSEDALETRYSGPADKRTLNVFLRGQQAEFMQALLAELLNSLSTNKKLVFTSLVETRGSTPQKAGAAMLVYEDGSQAGTLGGGCVEAEIKRTALECLNLHETRIATFQLDHDYGWDDGLICGGRMSVLIAPLASNSSTPYYKKYLETLIAGAGCTEVVTMQMGDGVSCSTQPASRYLFDTSGILLSQLADAPPVPQILSTLRPLEQRPGPYTAGGIAFLPHLRESRLVIVGAGHVGRQLSAYASESNFEVWVVDDRADCCNAQNIPQAARHVVGRFEEILPSLEITPETFCVVVTRGHNHDEEALLHLIRRQPAYLGMIGSARKIRLIFDDLRREGISEELLQRVHAPIGLPIHSRTVPEIAISIVAELIATRNGMESRVRTTLSSR